MTQTYISFNQAQQKLADIEAIDYFFAKEICTALASDFDLTNKQEPILIHLLMALSMSLRAGHTCLPLSEIGGIHWAVAFNEQGECSHQGYLFPNVDVLTLLLSEFELGVFELGAFELDINAQHPVVFDNNNLYMRRYFQFETELAQQIYQRLTAQSLAPEHVISAIVSKLFPIEEISESSLTTDPKEIDWQKIAVANAINKNFTVIAGGPGTGKTYTVTKLLAALLMLNLNNVDDEHILDIALVAPTGKAAQRLSESIINAISGFKGLIDDTILSLMPTQAKTIHRLLGVIPNSPNFRHNQKNLLSCDVLLIDEVSMVDLPMMTRIFRALKPEAKVILLGDADQLPSVAVGSVLADISPRPHCGYSAKNLSYLAQVCQVDQKQLAKSFDQTNLSPDTHHDHLSFLVKSRRFDGDGGIGKLADHVIKGQSTKSWQLLTSSTEKEPHQLSLANNNLNTWLAPLVNKYYQGIAQCSHIEQAFIMLAKFRVLCVTRQGEFGVDALNQWIKEQLAQRSYTSQHGYHGMPIMINENDYRLGLFNGDIGLLWRCDDGHLMAFFESSKQNDMGEKSYKTLLPSRLPKYDSVYAMTIHKTQGSEFEHVAIVLPKQEHQLLSRELLYTGITRAKTALTIASNSQTWQQGVKTAIKRYSGLTL